MEAESTIRIIKNTKSRKKRRRYILAALAVAIIGAFIFNAITGEEGIKVDLGSPSFSDITEKIPANGKILPVTEVKISPDVSGEIVELLVDEGDAVQKGQLIIKIKQDVYISMLNQAEATLNSTKAQYMQQEARFKQAQTNYERNEKLYNQKAISLLEHENTTAEYEMAVQQLKAAEFNISSAQAALDEARENLTKTLIYSPIDGIVSSLSVEKGERVVGTSQMAGTEMMRIADFDQMEVLVDVNENDIIRVSEGDTALIDVDAYPGKEFLGTVTKIANSAKNLSSSNDVTNFEVKIAILQDSYKELSDKYHIPFRPGMSASVEIITERKKDILTVPLGCVTSKETVFVYDPATSTVQETKISTGIQDITSIEVTSGLDSDTVRIVTGPYSTLSGTLTDGMAVTPNETEQ